jgi:hypothetical protein
MNVILFAQNVKGNLLTGLLSGPQPWRDLKLKTETLPSKKKH